MSHAQLFQLEFQGDKGDQIVTALHVSDGMEIGSRNSALVHRLSLWQQRLSPSRERLHLLPQMRHPMLLKLLPKQQRQQVSLLVRESS